MAEWPYSTARWQRLRKLKLAEEPRCQGCLPHRLTIASHVDHLHAISDGGDAFPSLDGLRSLCLPCHSAKTARGPEAGAIKTSKPQRGCDSNGVPLAPNHPWNAGAINESDFHHSALGRILVHRNGQRSGQSRIFARCRSPSYLDGNHRRTASPTKTDEEESLRAGSAGAAWGTNAQLVSNCRNLDQPGHRESRNFRTSGGARPRASDAPNPVSGITPEGQEGEGSTLSDTPGNRRAAYSCDGDSHRENQDACCPSVAKNTSGTQAQGGGNG